MPKGHTSTGKEEKKMPKGCTYTGKEAAQKVLDMSTDSNMDTEQSDLNTSNKSSVDSELEEYMDTVLCRDGAKHVYGRKRGHTESSMADKDKLSDDSFEFTDDDLQLSPQRSLQNLCSCSKRMCSGSPIPTTSTLKPAMQHSSMPIRSGGGMVSMPLSPVPTTSTMPMHSRHTSMPGHASACSTLPSSTLKHPHIPVHQLVLLL